MQAAGTMTMRLADAEMSPFEFTNFTETVGNYDEETNQLPKQNVDLAPLHQAVKRLERAADDYDRAAHNMTHTGKLPAE